LVKHKQIIATDHLLKNKEKENEFDQPNNSNKEGPENEIILSQNWEDNNTTGPNIYISTRTTTP
jgi:hypothetical protein